MEVFISSLSFLLQQIKKHLFKKKKHKKALKLLKVGERKELTWQNLRLITFKRCNGTVGLLPESDVCCFFNLCVVRTLNMKCVHQKENNLLTACV